MMAETVQFDVDDTSPSISYSPFGDTLSIQNLRAGWNPYFDQTRFVNIPGQTGSGSSFHITSLNEAKLSLPWHGTGIQLIGNATNAAYTVTLDGTPTQPNSTNSSNNILAAFEGLANTNHTIFLTAHTTMTQDTDSFIAFDKAHIISPPPAAIPANSVFTMRTLNDSKVTFLGPWNNTQNGSDPSHVSTTAGDRAKAKFMGTTFFLTGTTSPFTGQYSVTLDDVTTKYTGQSSFTKLDTLLFFASGLDPQIPHEVEVVNDDGSLLALQVGGFKMMCLGDPTPPPSASPSPPPSPSPSPSVPPLSNTRKSYPGGTVLALVLAGVLALVSIVGFLLFVLVYRPRKRRLRQAKREMRKKQRDAGAVLDIRPDVDAPADTGNGSRRSSGRTGFVEALGLAIKRSTTGKERERLSDDDDGYDVDDNLSPKSAMFSTSSSREKGKDNGTGKGKYMKTSKTDSTSTSFNIDLPSHDSQPNSALRLDADQAVPPLLTQSPGPRLSQVPISYYIPSPFIPSRNILVPSPNPNSNRNSSAIPQPKSYSRSRSPKPLSPDTHTRADSQGLLVYGERNANSPDEGDYEPHSAPLLNRDFEPPTLFVEDDRTAHHDAEDTPDTHWTASSKDALKSLSPRTSYSRKSLESRGTFGVLHRKDGEQDGKESFKFMGGSTESEVPPGADGETPLIRQREPERPRERSRGRKNKQRSDSFLNIRESSPFRVDFGGSSSGSGVMAALGAAAARVSRSSGLSHVRFQQDRPETKEGERKAGDKVAEQEQSGRDKRRVTQSTAHLTRLTTPAGRSDRDDHGRRVITSFLDFGGSSDTSVGTRSAQTSGSSSQRNRSSSLSVQPPSDRSKRSSSASSPNRISARWRKSWWSSSSHIRGGTASSGDSSSASRQHIPPLPSPGPLLPSQDQAGPSHPPQPPATDQSLHPLSIPSNDDTQSQLHSHPIDLTSIHTSPTDSVTVSDILFRPPDTDDPASRPGTGTAPSPSQSANLFHDRIQPASSAPSTPALIVQRVLGINNPAATSHGLGQHHGRSYSASGLLSTPAVRNEYANPSSRSSPEDKSLGATPRDWS